MVPAGKGLRLSPRETTQAVKVGSPGRLKVLEPLLRHATKVRVYGGDNGVSGWEVVFPDASFHMVLSPKASRGFSGEGQVLSQLAHARKDELLAEVRASLQWQAKVDATMLASTLGADHSTVSDALALLGTRGLVGYDLAE